MASASATDRRNTLKLGGGQSPRRASVDLRNRKRQLGTRARCLSARPTKGRVILASADRTNWRRQARARVHPGRICQQNMWHHRARHSPCPL